MALIKYYGGKNKMAKYILSIMPLHNIYVEPFFGGGAIFFSKRKVRLEVINDINDVIVSFYRVLQDKDKHAELLRRTKYMLRSETIHKEFLEKYKSKNFTDEIDKAYCFFYLSNFSYSSIIDSAMSLTHRVNIINKLKALADAHKRLSNTIILNRDACEVVEMYDYADALIYCDPPYYNAEMGHYDGYTEEDFKKLLDTLSKLKKAKFILSSYPSEILNEYIQRNKWYYKEVVNYNHTSVTNKNGIKLKTEAITTNYDTNAMGLFAVV